MSAFLLIKLTISMEPENHRYLFPRQKNILKGKEATMFISVCLILIGAVSDSHQIARQYALIPNLLS